MASTLYRRREGTRAPEGGQIRAVWAWLVACRTTYPDRPAYEGAMAAAEWVVGLSNVRPVAGKMYRELHHLEDAAFSPSDLYPESIVPATQRLIADEINAAADAVEQDYDANRRSYAFGVHAFLSWWAGVADLPEQLTPNAAPLVPRQAGAA